MRDPHWAVASIKKMYAEKKARFGKKLVPDNLNDPFGGGDRMLSLNLNMFYRRLAMMPAQQRQALRESLGGEIFTFGEQGWMSGMAARMAEEGLASIAAEVSDPDSGVVDSRLIGSLAQKDWKKAKQWVDQNGGGYDQDSSIWKHAQKENRAASVEWYLSRSGDAEDRAKRIDDVAQGLETQKDGVDWLLGMEAAGEPVQDAWVSMINVMTSRGNIDEAVAYLPRLAENELRREQLEKIYQGASNRSYIHAGETIEFVTLNEKHAGLLVSHPEFRDFVISKNNEAMEKFSAIIGKVERQLDGE